MKFGGTSVALIVVVAVVAWQLKKSLTFYVVAMRGSSSRGVQQILNGIVATVFIDSTIIARKVVKDDHTNTSVVTSPLHDETINMIQIEEVTVPSLEEEPAKASNPKSFLRTMLEHPTGNSTVESAASELLYIMDDALHSFSSAEDQDYLSTILKNENRSLFLNDSIIIGLMAPLSFRILATLLVNEEADLVKDLEMAVAAAVDSRTAFWCDLLLERNQPASATMATATHDTQ